LWFCVAFIYSLRLACRQASQIDERDQIHN
jgi:hypothetical protein